MVQKVKAVFLSVVAFLVMSMVVQGTARKYLQGGAPWQTMLVSLAEALILAGATLVLVIMLAVAQAGVTVGKLGLSLGPRRIFGGIVIGAATAAMSYALWPAMVVIAGAARLTGYLWRVPSLKFTWWVNPLSALLIALAVGFSEELFFRGYLERGIMGRAHPLVRIAVSALSFTVVHWPLQGISTVSAIGLPLAAILFSLMTLRYNSLWPAIGFHAAWNWVQVYLVQITTYTSGYRALFLFAPLATANRLWRQGGVMQGAILLLPMAVLSVWYAIKVVRSARVALRHTEDDTRPAGDTSYLE
jgi:membrane protease YdiL (CAAX protease family)